MGQATASDLTGLTVLEGDERWSDGLYAPHNGKIYGIPWSTASTSILLVDPTTAASECIAVPLPNFSTGYRWHSGGKYIHILHYTIPCSLYTV